MAAGERYAIGVDIGGTFTDCTAIGQDSAAIFVSKVPTTPSDPAVGFFDALEAVAAEIGVTPAALLASTVRLVHGTTRGTNALIARSAGIDVGLLVTSGHRDVMQLMGGSGRTDGLPNDALLHLPSSKKPKGFTSRHLTLEVVERVDSDGDIVVPINEERTKSSIKWLLDQGVGAIAVSYLWSVKNPAHENLTAAWIAEMAPGLFVSCGHQLGAHVGEYPRTSTAVMNAYIGPLMVRYVSHIEETLARKGFRGRVLFAQCAGGAITGDEVRAAPLRTLQSGPVGGVTGSAFLANRLGAPDVLTVDMGGTTADVSVIRRGEPMSRPVSIFERFRMALPMLDVESVGAGGGSIAWIDDSGRFQVGPHSAGADPGPVCYGRGNTEPTVTDADLLLGFIDPDRFLHGKMTLDKSMSEKAISELGGRLGLNTLQTAAGIARIVDNKMADLVRRMSVLRGFDPRDYTMYAFGGGGPVHAASVARAAGVRRFVVPLRHVASVWSAFGAACSDITSVFEQPVLFDLPIKAGDLEPNFAILEERARASLDRSGLDSSLATLRRRVRMKYAVQVHDIEVPLDGVSDEDIEETFAKLYEDVYGKGSGYREGGIQITSCELRSYFPVPKPALPNIAKQESSPDGSRDVYWDQLREVVKTPVLVVGDVQPSGSFSGPLLIDLPDSVVVVPPGDSASFDSVGNVVVDLK